MIPGTLIKPAGEKGLGVFAVKPFKKGFFVVRGKPEKILDVRTNHSFQIDLNRHAELDTPARLINHSCSPNLGVKNNNLGGYDFVALRDIFPGEELGWDYAMTEFISIAIRNACKCKTDKCRVNIGGFVCLPFEIRNRYGSFIADYLKRI